MATIEERAKDYAKRYPLASNFISDIRIEAYIQGATEQDPISRAEQKKIDIEKACEWLKEHKLLSDKYKGLYTRYGDLSEFRKAMEE